MEFKACSTNIAHMLQLMSAHAQPGQLERGDAADKMCSAAYLVQVRARAAPALVDQVCKEGCGLTFLLGCGHGCCLACQHFG